jgi:hypothetical protein
MTPPAALAEAATVATAYHTTSHPTITGQVMAKHRARGPVGKAAARLAEATTMAIALAVFALMASTHGGHLQRLDSIGITAVICVAACAAWIVGRAWELAEHIHDASKTARHARRTP